MKEGEIKLDRALKLTLGLSGENIRWAVNIEVLRAKDVLIPGNCVIGAGMISYAGPFISEIEINIIIKLGLKIDRT